MSRPYDHTLRSIAIPQLIPQPGGAWLLKPGRPILETQGLSSAQVSKILGLSMRQVQYMCECGKLQWSRPGGPTGRYKIDIQSVLSLLEIKHLVIPAKGPPVPKSYSDRQPFKRFL